MTKLVIHYTPDFLVVLKRTPCPDHNAYHTTCDRGETLTVVGLHLLAHDERSWCLERSWLK